MKPANYRIMIALLIFVELFSILYFNNPNFFILIFSLLVLIAYLIYCKKSISSNINKSKIEKIMIATISIITILKIITLIPIVSLKNRIVEPMKEIDMNYTSYSSFTELRKVANITATNVDTSSAPINIPYFGNLGTTNYLKNLYLDSPIINAESNYNNSYSNFVKSTKKSNAIYGEAWISATSNLIEEIQKNALFLTIFSIVYEFLIIAIPITIRKKS